MERNGWQWHRHGHGMVARGPRARPACTRALPCHHMEAAIRGVGAGPGAAAPSLSPPLHSTPLHRANLACCHAPLRILYPSVRVTVQYVCVGVVVWQ